VAALPVSRGRRRVRTKPDLGINRPPHAPAVCLELEDHSTARRSAVDFFQLWNQRDPQPQAARLAEQFIVQNHELMSRLGVWVEKNYDGSDVTLLIHAGSSIGAIPLFSPTTARPDYGLVVQPRFAWAGIGPMLGEMGWRVTPTPLRLPLLHRSERRVPAWVLSSMILVRLKALLESLDRRFEITSESRSAPRGRIEWTQYATRSLPRANFLSIPCRFADLRDDRLLKGAVRHALEQQIQALETQKEHGPFIHRLLEFAQELLRTVHTVPAYIPSATAMNSWMRRPMRTDRFLEGLQAIEWTNEERGLAGLSDLEGIPWIMPMDQFFEAWIETVFGIVARQTGGSLKVGRKHETTQPIAWEPPYQGSQKSLVPDVWLEWDSATLIVDAKYKRHWEEMRRYQWADLEEQLRNDHRNDLLQVLAYANLAKTPRVIVCLAYPCSLENWHSLNERGRALHKAEISVGSRTLHLWLTAAPMAATAERIASPLTSQVRAALQ
jgi:5-methylcytosine-specific restriction endonuclease McrBC regulatory subunit McrC